MERPPRYSAPFFCAYFFYYAGYCVFSSFIVLYLTQRGMSATLCGVITSLSLLANLLMEPVGGYATDTLLSTRSYLLLCAGLICGLCLLSTALSSSPLLCVALLILEAGLSYPFSQLMDAWVDGSRALDPNLSYTRGRAGGSMGFAAASAAAGCYFQRFGWSAYFLLQAGLFLAMAPFLLALPRLELGNRKRAGKARDWLSPAGAFSVLLHSPRYLLCLLLCTTYWFSHRPVGSYLSLIIQDRSGDAGAFGAVCAVGAVVECASLLGLAALQRRAGRRQPLGLLLGSALATDVLRPLCMCLLPGIWPLYLGQGLQSVSFALYYSASVECFSRAADQRIRSFSISMGLTASSVAGTVAANLAGGWLCDLAGSWALVHLSLGVSVANCLLLLLCFRRLFPAGGEERAGC